MTKTPTFDPWEHAERVGVKVIHHHLPYPENGRWYPQSRLIVLNPGMPFSLERCVLAHEEGHEAFGHAGKSRKAEVQADRWAAAHLIDMRAFRDLARATPDEGRLCLELNVTVRMLRVFMYMHGLVEPVDLDARSDGRVA